MFKYWSIKKYGKKLHPTLQKRFGEQRFYSASQVRETIYKFDFNPEFLPLGYILFLESNELNTTLKNEFPDININQYKKEMLEYLHSRSYDGDLQVLEN